MFKTTLIAAAVAVTLPFAAFAESMIEVHDAYVRSSGAAAKSGAAFMVMYNHGDTDDRLVAASSPAAERLELHTHIADADGVMKMREIEGGIEMPAGGEHVMARGGDHVMFLGLTAPFEQGAMIPLTLTFEKAGDVDIKVMVDLERMPSGHGMKHGSGGEGHKGHKMAQ